MAGLRVINGCHSSDLGLTILLLLLQDSDKVGVDVSVALLTVDFLAKESKIDAGHIQTHRTGRVSAQSF